MTLNNQQIKLAISTCPNDTFAFHAILNRKIDLQGLDFQIELLDIQQLNDGLFENRFDVAKASFHAALKLANQTVVLPSGSALGFGVGPLLLAAQPDSVPNQKLQSREGASITLCPGELTTATLLYKLFYADAVNSQHNEISYCVFSDIMPKLQNQIADFGVCIHEGRFTWEEEGLFCVEDLGTRWESETKSPLPLGGILASRELTHDVTSTIQKVIRASIEYGLANRAETIPTMSQYAQEFSDEVLMQHVDLYVNDWTLELGEVGKGALNMLSKKSRECGLLTADSPAIEIWHE